MSELSTNPGTSASTNPHNAKYPEIITETETDERVESTEEQKLVYESGAPRGTSIIKKVTVSKIKIRTTTPYLGTV